VLRFSISHKGDWLVPFEMKITGGEPQRESALRRTANRSSWSLSSDSNTVARYYIPMRLITYTLALSLGCLPLLAKDEKAEKAKADARLDDAASLFSEIMATPDKSIPQSLLDKAACVVLVPGLKKGAFVVGGKYGRGFALCRASGGEGWGPPAAVAIEGGSFGLQVGYASSDVVLLIMNERGMRRLASSKFTIGGEATAAAGPVGRDITAQTDALLTAEILSWSRSRGIFGGVSLDGATLRSDMNENEALYGKRWTNQQILTSGTPPPESAAKLLALLNKYSPRQTH
jgi:SH3 domain-containing YSC84-like protein 1